MTQEKFVKKMAGRWGLKGKEKEMAIKHARIDDLFIEVDFSPFDRFFDHESDQLLDEKIEVLTALKEGKYISDIPNFYDILELYPKDQEKDGIITKVCWD